MKRGEDTMTDKEVFVNRKLWDDIFDVLKQHQDNCHDILTRPQILRIQIDTLYTLHTILSNTLDACNNRSPDSHRVITALPYTPWTDEPGIVITSTLPK